MEDNKVFTLVNGKKRFELVSYNGVLGRWKKIDNESVFIKYGTGNLMYLIINLLMTEDAYIEFKGKKIRFKGEIVDLEY